MELEVSTYELASIREYTGLSFAQIIDLPIGELLLYRRDAWVSKMKSNEKGREFLQTLWRLQQTEADEEAIKRFNERG